MKSLLSITVASLILVIGLGACGLGDKPPVSDATVLGAQTVDPVPRALNQDIAFDMEANYSLGDPVEIAIRNDSNQNYYYQSEYPACFNLQFFDDSQESRPYPYADPKSKERVLSPGRFIVPGGTHCDLLFEQALKPGQSVALFTWDQLMCTKDRWGCQESVPVEPGEYLIRGEFSRKAKVIGFGAKKSADKITTATWGFTIQPAVAGSQSVTPISSEAPFPTPSQAQVRDAKVYAADQGIGLDEALRRLGYQDAIGGLGAKLAANERDTFAGLWIQHRPDFRVIVQFTRDGEKTVRPYIENEPWADLIEVRTADVTLVELEYIRAETTQALRKLSFGVRLKSNVMENRVEVHVTDGAWFEGVLREADIHLPDEVVLVVVEGLSVKDINFDPASPVPGVAFLRQKPVEGERVSMTALARGELVLTEGCLRMGSAHGNLLVWPADFTLRSQGGVLEVLDGTGQVVARVGEEVRMGGGEVSYVGHLGEYVEQQLPPGCPGPYWIVGTGVRLAAK